MAAFLRRALAFFLPVAVLAVLGSGLIYTAVQQDLRQTANDPQVQMAEDAARALDGGAAAGRLVGPAKVDVARSLAPFLVIFDGSGAVLATDGQLDGHDPVPPLGVLAAAHVHAPNNVTWQPREGVRVATVSVPWRGGTVMAGRSLRLVEEREDLVFQIAVVGGLVMLVALAVASLGAAWLWPPGTPPATAS